MTFDSLDAVRAVAGQDYEDAIAPLFDQGWNKQQGALCSKVAEDFHHDSNCICSCRPMCSGNTSRAAKKLCSLVTTNEDDLTCTIHEQLSYWKQIVVGDCTSGKEPRAVVKRIDK